MSFFALGRLKNHKVPHLHPNSTMFMPLDRLQLKIYAFSGKFNVCSKHVLLSWIKICRDFTLQTQIFTQKYRSWLRFYSEFLRKKLAVGGSDPTTGPDRAHRQKQNCIYPRLFGLQIIVRKLTLHKTPSVLEYIPPPGPTGPTDIGTTACIHLCLASKSVSENWLCTQHHL